MADVNLSQGVLFNPGTSGNDTFYVPITRTGTTSFLSGSYSIDANSNGSMLGVGGNDTLVFKATNLFTSGNYLFLPQFELVSGGPQGYTPTWIAYDQRSAPFSVSWPNFGSGDKVTLELWNTTPESPTTPIKVAVSEGTVNNISQSGQATSGFSQAFHIAQTQTVYTQYLDSLFWDNDTRWAGSYYVMGGNGYLGQSETASATRLTAQLGSSPVDLGGGVSNYIYNQVKDLQGSFFNGSPYKAVAMEIHVDANALMGGRNYLELIGSIGSNAPTNAYERYNTNYFTDKIPDVEYDIYIDSSAAGGLTVHETDTGTRNWSDRVRYSDIGITQTGVSGQVNTGSANNYGANGSNGVTLTTGVFNADGSQTTKATIANANASEWLTLSYTGSSFAVGDKVYLSGISGYNNGQLQNNNVYKVLEVSGNQVKLTWADGGTNTALNFTGATGLATATFQKLNDYDVTVMRGGATDVFAGMESFELTTGDDVINFNGTVDSNWMSVEAGKGADTWNLSSKGDWSTLSIWTSNGPGTIMGTTNAVAVNLSGATQGFNSPTGYRNLNASASFQMDGTRRFTGSMLDEYGFTDTFNIDSGAQYTDSLGISLEGTSLSDRYYFAVDGLGTIGEYYVQADGGYDQIFLLNDATGATSKNVWIQPTNFSKVGGVASISMEGYSRFSQTASYEVTFETVNAGQTSTKLAKITQVSTVTGSTTDTLNVANVADWSVGDVVTLRSTSGASLGANLVSGTSYRIREVTAGTGLKLEELNGTDITALTSNPSLTGVSIERLVDTGVVEKNYITFGDAAGDFSRLAFQYDGSLLDTTKFAFRVDASDVLPTVTLGTDFDSRELAQNEKLANLVVDYRDLYDNLDPFTSGSISSNGIQYFNGLVDKGALGFDRLVDYQDTDVVGQRRFMMTDNDDVIIQSAGSSSLELKFSLNQGQDKIFVDGRSDDANQRIEINLGRDPWNNGSDGSLDTVEIGLSSLNKNYKSVQYIDITNADRSDVIRFVDAEGYTVQLENSRAVGPAPTSYKNYVTYNVYQGDVATSNLVMTVRVGTGDVWSFQSWGNTALDQFSSSNGETVPLGTMWGSVTSSERSISGSAPAVAQTAGNDAAIIFEDRSSSVNPYFMGAGDDYVVSMGGDQDIALGAGNDYISVRNSGQQMFVSGGAGTDSIGLSGFYTTLSDGSYVSDQWSFSSMDVNKAKAVMAAKYPNLSTATDPFEWSTTALDRVMVATNRLDGTALFFQAEKLSFSNGSVDSEYFLPPINETYDLTLANTAAITLYGRATNDTINLKVDDVDQTLKFVGSWLDAKNTSLVTTGNTLLGAHTLSINAQTAATPKWFSNTYTNAGINLVDVENIRLFDSAGRDVTVRVAGSSGYESVSEAVAYANRGDVIFVAETVQGALTGTTRATINMDTTVSIASGLRVAFEEGTNRTVNTTAQLTVNMTEEVKTSSSNRFLGTDSHVLELLGTANINVNGSSANDIIVGNKGNNVINGLAGNDLIFGGNGSDMLIGGIGDDALIGGSSHKASAIANFAGENWSLFNASTDSFTTADPQALEFKTGDKLVYTATGGTGVSAYIGGVATNLTSSTALYAIRTDNVDGSATFKLASTQANALNGVFIDIIANGTATSHAFTIDNIAYTAANLPGNDYLYGGSGNDHLIATGVMGSLTTVGVRDTLTMNGGSGADTLTVLSNTGLINAFGGSGSDKFEVMDSFMDAVGVNKAERIVDFSATQDDVQSYFALADLGSVSVESRLNAGGVTLSQLVAPPLPIVSGSGENGNYQSISDQVNSTYVLPDFGLNVADLINLHNAHAA